jgi:hypothetical protein
MEEHDFFSACKEKNASRWNTTFSAYRKTDKKVAVLVPEVI